MKYGTKELYDIEPEQLANMKTIDYLRVCRDAAIAKRNALVLEREPMWKWSVEKNAMIEYLNKAINSREFLLEEMENKKCIDLKKIFMGLIKIVKNIISKQMKIF